jgi:hypothetical protein
MIARNGRIIYPLGSVCEVKAKAELQRLKPLGFRRLYVVAKATTHKASREARRKPRPTKLLARQFPFGESHDPQSFSRGNSLSAQGATVIDSLAAAI